MVIGFITTLLFVYRHKTKGDRNLLQPTKIAKVAFHGWMSKKSHLLPISAFSQKKKKKRKKGGAIFWCPRLKTSFCHSYKKVVLRGMFYFSANISNWWQNEVCFANMKCLFFSPTYFFSHNGTRLQNFG